MKLLSRIFNKKTNNKIPELLFIEPTNRCNLNCPFCLVNTDDTYPDTSHNSMKRPFGFMDMELYNKIMTEAKKFGIKRLNLEFWGEPFLHPNIDEMISRAASSGFTASIFTNGLALKEKHFKVIPNNLKSISLSIDGASENTYKQNREGGNFELVWGNLLKLSSICRNTGTSVRWQFIVMKNNEHEVGLAKELAKKHNIKLVLKTFNPSVKDLVTSKSEHSRKASNKPCRSIYKQFGILWNGNIVACCQDPDGREILGNIGESSLYDIWNGIKYKEFRDRVDKALISPDNEPAICKTCLSYK